MTEKEAQIQTVLGWLKLINEFPREHIAKMIVEELSYRTFGSDKELIIRHYEGTHHLTHHSKQEGGINNVDRE